jgi:hypothetical protein
MEASLQSFSADLSRDMGASLQSFSADVCRDMQASALIFAEVWKLQR